MSIAKIQPQPTGPDFSQLVDLMPKGPSGKTRSCFELFMVDISDSYFQGNSSYSVSDCYESENSVHGVIWGVQATGFLTTDQYRILIDAHRKIFSDLREAVIND